MYSPASRTARRALLFGLAILCSVFGAGAQAQDRPGAAPLGVNLEGIADYARLTMFSDLMKSSRRWGSARLPWVHDVNVDEDGWPLEDAGVVVRIVKRDPGETASARRYLRPGIYTLSFTGKAQVTPVASRGVTVRGMRHDRQTQRSSAEVVVGHEVSQLMLSFTDTQGGIRDAHLLSPGTRPGQVFTDEFLRAVEPFSVLRLLGPLAPNSDPPGTWSQRPRPDAASQGGPRGMAWEYAVALANEARKDIWITIPFKADDAYVRALAQLLKTGLAPERNVYLEFSNELWNHAFKQTRENTQAAVAEALAGDLSLTRGQACTAQEFSRTQGRCNAFWAGQFRVGKRIARIAEIFSDVFGRDAMNARVRPVLATQFANRAMAEQVLKNIAIHRGKPSSILWGIASAPYIYLDHETAKSTSAQEEEILASLVNSLDTGVLPFFPAATGVKEVNRGAAYTGGDWTGATQKALADFYGLRSAAYEGGVDMRQYDVNLPAKYRANLDARMGSVVERLLTQWYGCGNDLFVYLSLTSAYNRWGYWGLTHDPRDLNTPKLAAARRAAATAAAGQSCS